MNMIQTTTKKIKIEDLFLDPNNPRFSTHHRDEIIEADIARDETQERTFRRMLESSSNFAIDELADSIRNKGFKPVGRLFVRKIGNKYLVIEGNRRITAVKYLLKKHNEGGRGDKLPKEILDTISTVECEDLTGATVHDIRLLLGLVHLGSFKEWKPMPAAYNIYRTYMEEYCAVHGGNPLEPNTFVYDAPTAKKVKDIYSIKLSEVRDYVRIYRAHQQLLSISRDSRVGSEDNFSMIGDTISKPVLRDFFQFDESRGMFSDEGAEQFLDLCMVGKDGRDRVITAPASGESSLRDFAAVLSDGTPEDRQRIVEDREPAGQVAAYVKSRLGKPNLINVLDQVLALLGKIEIDQIQDEGLNDGEKKCVKQIYTKLEKIEGAASATKKKAPGK